MNLRIFKEQISILSSSANVFVLSKFIRDKPKKNQSLAWRAIVVVLLAKQFYNQASLFSLNSVDIFEYSSMIW